MKHLVAVEDGLTPITLLLKQEGYDVVSLDGDRWKDAEAVVVSGMDEDFLGVTSRSVETSIITAAGKTPDEVLKDVRRVQKKSR